MSVNRTKVEFRIKFVFCVYYGYVKLEHNSSVKRQRKKESRREKKTRQHNNRFHYYWDGWMGVICIYSLYISHWFWGWLLCTCHSTNFYDAFAYCVDVQRKHFVKINRNFWGELEQADTISSHFVEWLMVFGYWFMWSTCRNIIFKFS